jgi:DNA-binding Lrp family transcriptional regulator
MDNILKLLEDNGRLNAAQLADINGENEKDVALRIKEYEKNGVIAGYQALIDWDKTDREYVTALIEIKVAPQKGMGFDKVASRIYAHKEVRNLYLMSGGFDLFVVVEGKSMKEVALFVDEKLAPIDSVLSCATHFVLKKYKDSGIVFNRILKDDREAVVL